MERTRVSYAGWNDCLCLSNPALELIITTAVGPRIIRCARPGGENLFFEAVEELGDTGGDSFRLYGGHRLWHAPEDSVRTYQPDNQPVLVEELDDFVRLAPPFESVTGIQKELEVSLDPVEARVTIVHRLRNRGLWPITLAPWALSVMAPGGLCILPLPPRGTHPEFLAPSSTLVLWPYTNLADPRWTLGERFLLLRQEPSMPAPQKIGAYLPDGWIGYAKDSTVFIKQADVLPNAPYPDMCASHETFTNHRFIEIETLGPVAHLEPGEAVEHTERWSVHFDVGPVETEQDVIERVLPLVQTHVEVQPPSL